MKTQYLFVLIPMAAGITACQTHPTPPKSFSLGPVQAEALGAQHRVVYSIPKALPGSDKPNASKGQSQVASEDPLASPPGNTFANSYSAFCAEPSPDAMNALASSLGLNLQAEDKLKLGMSVAQNISSTNIGLRTAAIQALRDITYRNCEAYANGAISGVGLETLQRRFQSTMVSILAIEQLTGAVTPPTVALTGKAEAMDTANYATLASLVEKKEGEVTTLTTARDNAKTKYDTEKAKENNQDATDTAEGELKQAQDALDTAKTELESLKTAMTNLIPSSQATSQTMAANIGNGGGSRVSDATMEKLAATVQQITKDTLVLGFGREVCTSILGRSFDQPSVNEALGLEQMTKQLKATETRIVEETKQLQIENGADFKADTDPVLMALNKRKLKLQNRIASGETFVNPVVQTCINLLQEDISTAQANIENAKLYSTQYWEVMNGISGKIGSDLDANGFATAVAAFNGGSVTIKTPVVADPAFLADDDKKKCDGKDKKSKQCTDQTNSGKANATKKQPAIAEATVAGNRPALVDINDGKGNQGLGSPIINLPMSTIKLPKK